MSVKLKKLYKTSRERIIETHTNSTICTVSNKEKRKKVLEMLNSGTGFEGFTPPFFLNPPLEK
jgi:hypothetical protein